jgi:hypothetical protein
VCERRRPNDVLAYPSVENELDRTWIPSIDIRLFFA